MSFFDLFHEVVFFQHLVGAVHFFDENVSFILGKLPFYTLEGCGGGTEVEYSVGAVHFSFRRLILRHRAESAGSVKKNRRFLN